MSNENTYKAAVVKNVSEPAKFDAELSKSVLNQARAEGIQVPSYALTPARDIRRAPRSSR
ncbi:MAG: hypothetical protein R3E66_24430 [bacterium]